jgi:MOSC domain-containing protein YiiM
MLIKGLAAQIESRGPMVELTEEVAVNPREGLVVDYCSPLGEEGERQVIMLSQVQWREACTALGIQISWLAGGANVLVDDIVFGPNDLGERISFTGGAILEVVNKADPCERMEKIHPGIYEVLNQKWRGGVLCRVVKEGTLRPLAIGSIVY